MLQRSDFVHGVEKGFSVGVATGVLTGLVVIAFPPGDIILGGWTPLICALAGALMGAWVAGIIGTDIPNSRLKELESVVESGQVLMMVDMYPGERSTVSQI